MDFDIGIGARDLDPVSVKWIRAVFHGWFLEAERNLPFVNRSLVERDLNDLGLDANDYVVAWRGPVRRFVRAFARILRRHREDVKFFWGNLTREDRKEQIVSSVEQFVEDALMDFDKGKFINKHGWLITFDWLDRDNPYMDHFYMKLYIPKQEYAFDVMLYLEEESNPEGWMLNASETLEELLATSNSSGTV
eukprot:TRINITY_DN83_c0_g1_i1.p1 TRINITY_DN83_c0_g1~~TRINITY_DN83_c0_g1_i1.p1  ORF type:complete len:192 (-),score=1.87 TRINITY_DN83_c0_g1_i1:155-730(-)